MPPQIPRTDSGTPVNSQAPVTVEQQKTAEVDKSAAQKPEPPKQDAATAEKNSAGAKKHAEGTKQQETQRAQMKRSELDQKLPEKKNGKAGNVSKEDAQTIELAKKANADVMKGMKDAKAINLAHKANDHVMGGMQEAQSTYRYTLQQKGEKLATELKQLASGKPSFEERERMIEKIDAYQRELKASDNENLLDTTLYVPSIGKPVRKETYELGPFKLQKKSPVQDEAVDPMKKILGVYGFDRKISSGERYRQHENLDVALHNWRATPPQDRQIFHKYGMVSPPVKLPMGWKAPTEFHQENKQFEGKQVVLQNEPQGNYMAPPVARERENQTDPDEALAKGKHNLQQNAWDIAASAGPTHGTYQPSNPTRATIQPHHSAPPPERNVRETQPSTKSSESLSKGGANREVMGNVRTQENSQSVAQTSSMPSERSVNKKSPHSEKMKPAESKMPNVIRSQAPADRPKSVDEAQAREETRLQQRRLEDALENLDKDTLEVLVDRLRHEGTLSHDGSKEAQARRGLPGDKRPFLEEVREALIRSRDPNVTEVLESNSAGLTVQGELHALHTQRERVKLLRKDPPPMGEPPW